MRSNQLERIKIIFDTARREPDPMNGRPHVVLPLEAVAVVLDLARQINDLATTDVTPDPFFTRITPSMREAVIRDLIIEASDAGRPSIVSWLWSLIPDDDE